MCSLQYYLIGLTPVSISISGITITIISTVAIPRFGFWFGISRPLSKVVVAVWVSVVTTISVWVTIVTSIIPWLSFSISFSCWFGIGRSLSSVVSISISVWVTTVAIISSISIPWLPM